MISIAQSELMALAEKWEPVASQSPPRFRKATCIKCGDPMTEMWHLWLQYESQDGRHFVKEVHMCGPCGVDYAA